MSGFTVYETLRIFLPGALAVAIADALLRLATGRAVINPSPEVAAAVDLMEGPGTFLLLATAVGLLIYLMDLPENLRIFKGDPGWAEQPSNAMADLIRDADPDVGLRFADEGVSLFFLFTDKYLPDSLHQRVYLFGAIYKVATNLRILAVTALAVAAPAAVVVARGNSAGAIRFDLGAVVAVLIIASGVYLLGEVAWQKRVSQHLDSQRRKRPEDAPNEPADGEYAKPVVPDQGPKTVAVLLLAGCASVGFVALLPLPYSWIGVALGLVAVVLWYWLEVGPPIENSDRKRDRFLRWLGSKDSRLPQYTARQRTRFDLALYLPALLSASIASAHLGRSGSSVLAWVVFIVPATVTMTFRKHEARLLAAYRNQRAWITLHSDSIQEVLASRLGFAEVEQTLTSAPEGVDHDA